MTNAQTWTVMAAMLSLVGLMLAVLRFSLGSFQRVMEARFDAVDARFDAVDARFDHEREYNALRFDAIDRRFDALEHRVDALESDMSIIKTHLIGQRSA